MNALRGVQEHAVRPIEAESGVESGEVCMTEWEELAAKIRKKKGEIAEQNVSEDAKDADVCRPISTATDAKKEQVEVNLDEGVEEEYGKREVRKLHDPKLPNEQEVKEHSLSGHMPFRSWCPHCVRGRGKEMEHKRKEDEEEVGIPEYHMDYCFPGDAEGERLTVLVVIEKYTKMKKAVVVPSKGSTGSYAARQVLELMKECGDKDREVIVKSDQEPAIQFLIDDICTNRTGAKTIKEVSPKYSKGSNGVVERAVQSVEQCLRTLKSAVDEKFGVQIDVRHPVITWLCDYTGYMMNRMEVARDGKTPYERVKGKKAEVIGLEFGERVLWKHPPGKTMDKIGARWSQGLFVGVKAKSNELIVIDGDTKQVKMVRTVRRVPEEQRWKAEYLEWVEAVPWNHGKDDKDADGDMLDFDVKSGPGRKLTEQEKSEIAMNEGPRILHRAHLRRADFDKHGYTDRCPGCSALLRGLHAQPHSQACRDRLEGILEKDIRIKNAKARLRERGMKLKAGGGATTDDTNAKRRRLDDLEGQAMTEEDPEKLNKIFQEYRQEYLKAREEEKEEEVKRARTKEPEQMQEVASGSADAAVYTDMTVGMVMGEIDPWEYLENTKVEGKVEDKEAENTNEYAWDDVNDIPLPLDLVKAARFEEMGHMKNKIFKVVKKEEAWRVTGKAPISTKWVDTDKTHGTGEPMVRSRWVARDFKDPKDKDREDLFSATPPLEMIRLMISRQATLRADGTERKTMYLDIKKAHLAPLCMSDVYVELPFEAGVADDECGKLIHWLYGCRPAAQAWEEHYSALLVANGFERLKTVPVAFSHAGRDLHGVVHGDDFVWEGRDEDLDWILQVLSKEYELKNRGRLGFGPKDVRKIDILGRVIELTNEGIKWTGDPRHQQLLEDHFGMNADTKVLSKNGYDDDPEPEDGTNEELTADEGKTFRGLAARLNYMAQDNLFLQYPAKEICKNMARPRQHDFYKVKRVVRFQKGLGAVSLMYVWQTEEEAQHIVVYVDSDWAGCKVSRRSTSGGVLMVGKHVLRTWSSTQGTVATSSGEAELIAMFEGATRGCGLQAILSEMGLCPKLAVLRICTDSSVAKSFVATRGVGKMRHLEVKLLWLQEQVRRQRLRVGKVKGTANVADALTKYHSAAKLCELAAPYGVRWADQAVGTVGPRGGVDGKGQPQIPGGSVMSSN
jgi:hypothetical protein